MGQHFNATKLNHNFKIYDLSTHEGMAKAQESVKALRQVTKSNQETKRAQDEKENAKIAKAKQAQDAKEIAELLKPFTENGKLKANLCEVADFTATLETLKTKYNFEPPKTKGCAEHPTVQK
jgi:hypothetical protein